MEEIIDWVSGLDGVLTLRPEPGDGSPEIAWGDTFFYYAPDGQVPTNGQPFATVVTKTYPDEQPSGLDEPGAFRVNIAAGKQQAAGFAEPPVAGNGEDAIRPHPVYGAMGWLAVLNPGPRTEAATRELLRNAHGLARARHERRGDGRG